MGTLGDIDFTQIAPRLGSQRSAFEELCCQLARRTLSADACYTRLHGAGGDGGVECFADLPNGSRAGWQAKYVFSVGPLLTQATNSLTTALQIHPALDRYVLCFPFDLTGPTNRPGRSGVEKFEEWRTKRLGEAEGRDLQIEIWGAAELRGLLMDLDPHGGMRYYFFNELALSNEWFKDRLQEAKTKAGPRYKAELNVRTDVAQWFGAFGRTRDWLEVVDRRVHEATEGFHNFRDAVLTTSANPVCPPWPEAFREEAGEVCKDLDEAVRVSAELVRTEAKAPHEDAVARLQEALAGLTELDTRMSAALESEHGAGAADSPGFRQSMREYFATLPASNLDEVRKARGAAEDLRDWLQSPEAYLGFRKSYVLSGGWGVGKTHGACDVGFARADKGLLTCVVFGHDFDGNPDPWTRLAESLGLPLNLGREGLLSALNCAAEASGHPLIVIVDAINETRPRRYWGYRLLPLVEEIGRHSHLRVCVTCRTSFLPRCLPHDHGLSVVEHRGFRGIERIACQAFFEHYGLRPPIAPFLQSELSNPLYLRLLCETLAGSGEGGLPSGWSSMAKVIDAFLDRKEREFAQQKDVMAGARLITRSLHALARAMADSSQTKLAWSEAHEIVGTVDATANNLGLVEWLTGEGLLIEGGPDPALGSHSENTLRLSFERFGDFLLASQLLDATAGPPFAAAFDAGGQLHRLIANHEQVEEWHGVLTALSILIPERERGTELPQLAQPGTVQDALVEITLAALPGRDPSTFAHATCELVRKGLGTMGLAPKAMDSVLSVAWRPSVLDATWLHQLLQGTPLAKRDQVWCGYLHRAYEESGPPRRLIDAAFEVSVEELDVAVSECWATMLAWFTAAADRRVKDWATRALTMLLTTHPAMIPQLARRFLAIDDDVIRARVLLASYGALLRSRDRDAIAEVVVFMHRAFAKDPQGFDHALIRDYIRLIAELADELCVLPDTIDPELTMRPVPSEWPLDVPKDSDVESWSKVIRFRPNEFACDFFKYSMNCLRPWQDALAKDDMGKWIVQRVARDFGYQRSGCENYDSYMVGEYGGGRGKPKWAERVGKKYQWTAMYQLASRLNDHLERKRHAWEASLLKTPLILLDERKLDSTLPYAALGEKARTGGWWIRDSMDVTGSTALNHEKWIAKDDDLPSLQSMLASSENGGQTWRPLVLYPSWSEDRGTNEQRRPYRHAWMHVRCYLVPQQDRKSAYDLLLGRNFFGRWMPEGAEWSHGFPGEYPWATPFTVEPDEWHERGWADVSGRYRACCNQILGEWEYDASLSQSFGLIVPAREFFSPGDLWWDGRDGYGIPGGLTVFRDPSMTEGGTACLVADADDLPRRLESLGQSLVWTMLGEKIILGGSHDAPRRTFSQVARLRADGSVQVGDRVFFDDYDQDTGFPTTG